jgi:NAD(P)-dependent dehydrogenase (short-subunit alcohol dehydrogenase family)
MNLCILTGGSRGLGAALLENLEDRGWTVFEISRTGTSVNNVRFDLGDVNRLGEMLDWMEVVGRSQVWERVAFVHNAGSVEPIARMGKVGASESTAALQAGIVVPYALIARFVALFRESGFPKVVVNISSGAASKGYAGWSLYCAQKAALENGLRALSEEEKDAPRPFRVLSVNPHVMDTAMQERIREADRAEFPQRERFEKLKTDGQLLSVTDVARAVTDLVEDESAREFVVSVRERMGR